MERRHPYLHKAGLVLLGVFGFLLVALVAIAVYLTTPYFSASMGTWLTHRSGRNIALEGNIEAHWSREPRFIIRNVKIGNAEWGSAPTMFEADRIEVSIRLLELLRGRVVLPELILDRPQLLLEKNEKGDANWHFGQNPQAAVLKQPLPQTRHGVPIIHELRITDGSLTYKDPTKNTDTTLQVSTVQGDTNEERNISISGKGSYEKEPFTLDMTGASILHLRESDTPYPLWIKVAIGHTSAEAKGTVKDPLQLESFNMVLDLKGTNAADLFPILGVALPPTPPYDLQGRLTYHVKDQHWHFHDFTGHMGSSDLHGDVKWHPDDTPPYLEGTFISSDLDMKDLAGFVGAHRKPVDESRVLPDAPLDVSRLMAMNADVTFHGEHVRVPQMLEDFYMKVVLRNGVLTLTPITFEIAKGMIKGDVQIEGTKEPPLTSMQLAFHHLSLTSLFEPLAKRYGKKNISAGMLSGEANLTGTGKSLQKMLGTANGSLGFGMEGGVLSELLLHLIGLDLFNASAQVLKGDEAVAIHCMVSAFDVKNGMMSTREFLIDNDINTIRGKGTVNLADESMNLELHVKPKEFSLLSVRSPIIVKGTFKHPTVGLDPTSLAGRGGIAAALGALLAPPVALLAFIDTGSDKEKGPCATFLNQFGTPEPAKPVH